MSQYKPYPAYTDSGAQWIGGVPEGWVVKRLKYELLQNDGGVWGNDPDGGKNDIKVLRSTEQAMDGSWIIESPAIRKLTEREATEARLAEGDLVVTKSSGSEAHIGKTSLVTRQIANEGYCFANFMQRLRLKDSLNPKLAVNILNSTIAREQFAYLSNSTTGLANLSGSLINELIVAVPPIKEQEAIIESLSHETARIDALIAKKTRFVELLKEKRSALITHSVTKGLDPDTEMKYSGVEWIGEVPAHWEVVPSTWLFSECKDLAHAEDQHLSATQKYGVIPLAEFERLEGRQVTHAVKNLDKRKHAEIDNFVISMRSFEGGIERVKARGCVRSSYVVLLAQEKAHVGFFSYLFKSSAYIQGLQATASFIRDGQDLSYSNFRQVKLPSPSIDEQRQIADFLDRTVSRIDALITKTQSSIDLLKEHRTALVTAAVTGQIDLRRSV